MTQSKRDTRPSVQDVALIVGGGPGISSSCARLFAESGMRVCVAARNPEKPAMTICRTVQYLKAVKHTNSVFFYINKFFSKETDLKYSSMKS